MSEIEDILEMFRKGNTLAARLLLSDIREAPKDGPTGESENGNIQNINYLTNINRALFVPSSDADRELIQNETKRHLGLLPLATDDTRSAVLYNLGCFALYQEDIITAKLRFTEAAENSPDMIAAHHNLGYANELMTDLEEAEEAYGNALRLDADNVLSRINLAKVLLLEGKREEALDELKTAHQVGGGTPGVTLYLCRSLIAGRSNEEAEEILELLEKLPDWTDYPELKECAGMAHLQLLQFQRAGELFREVLEVDDNREFSRIGLIKALAKIQDFEELSKEVEKLNRSNPSEALEDLILKLNPK